MEVITKVLPPSPEAMAFRYYNRHVLEGIENPIRFAEVLLQEEVIGRDTKDSITSMKDVDQKRVLLNCVQQALEKAENKRKVLLKARKAMKNSGGDTYFFNRMNRFIDG